jgi:hypothetical protein
MATIKWETTPHGFTGYIAPEPWIALDDINEVIAICAILIFLKPKKP